MSVDDGQMGRSDRTNERDDDHEYPRELDR
jgi:hypothetical protein